MEYRLVTDWTSPGVSLEFLIPVPILFIGIFLLRRGMRKELSKGFLFGSATVNGTILLLLSSAALLYSSYRAFKEYHHTYNFVNQHQLHFHGRISGLEKSNSAYYKTIEISRKPFEFYQPIPKARFDGTKQVKLYQWVNVWFVKLGDKNVIVKLEVDASEHFD